MRKAEILDRIIKYYDLKTKTGLAAFLGVSPQTVSNWYSRDSIDYDLIFDKCSGIDFNWLIAGDSYGCKDSPKNIDVASDIRSAYEVPVLRNKIIPILVGYEATSGEEGGKAVLKFRDSVAIPENMLADGEYVAYRTDASMEPAFPEGDFLVCKRVVDLNLRKLKETSAYLCAVSGEKLVLRRIIAEKNAPSRIILRADNPDKIFYPDLPVGAGEIQSAWEAKLSLAQPQSPASEMEKRLCRLESSFADIKRAIETLAGKSCQFEEKL